MMKRKPGALARLATGLVGAAAGTYTGYVAVTWCRYGKVRPPSRHAEDPLLDRFMPAFEVVERHRVYVRAPADVTLSAACEMDLRQALLARLIFRGRELILGATSDSNPRPGTLLPLVTSLGWGVLAEIPGREIVVGAVTKPWEADVTFRALPPEEFAAFDEPGYAKIVWTLRADPIGPTASIFRTETRVTTTDAASRARFRRYWSFFSPGIILIRRTLLGPLKRDAERRLQSGIMAHSERRRPWRGFPSFG